MKTLLFVLIFSLQAHAQFGTFLDDGDDDGPKENILVGKHSTVKTNEPAADAKWEPQWTSLCSYDDFCHRLKNPEDSSWINPTRQTLEVLKDYTPDIKKAAALYGVDPKALTASLMADLTIIPSHEGEIHEYLARKAIGKTVAPYSPHFRLALVYDVAAQPVEELAATVEKRTVRTQDEVHALINTPKGTIYYAAAVLKDAQDTYAKYGIDIKSKPGILATLYNLGKVEPKAQALAARLDTAKTMKEKGASDADIEKAGVTPLAPRNNFFGLFTDKNMPLVEGVLNPVKAPDAMKYAAVDKADCKQKAVEALAVSKLVEASRKRVDEKAMAVITEKMQVAKPLPTDEKKLKAFVESPAGLNKLCPAPGKMTASSPYEYRCLLPGKPTDSQSVYVFYEYTPAFKGFTPTKEEITKGLVAAAPRDAIMGVCYLEAFYTKANSKEIAEVQKCKFENKATKSRADIYTGDTREFAPSSYSISDDPKVFVAQAIPLDCVLPGPDGVIPLTAPVETAPAKASAPAAKAVPTK